MTASTRRITIGILASPTSTLAALRPALKAADAYHDVSRLGVKALRAHAQTVAAAMDFDDAHDAAKAKADADAAKADADAAPVTRKLSTKQVANDAAVTAMAELASVDLAAFTAATGKGRTYWTASAWVVGNAVRQPATWNPAFVSAVRLGMLCSWDNDSKTVTLSPLPAPQADMQRANLAAAIVAYNAAKVERRAARPAVSKTLAAARVRPISHKAVAALALAIGATTPDADGAVVLTAKALAMAGAAASWAKVSNKHLADAGHVAARTLAACSMTGRTAQGCLVLTALVQEVQAIAS